MKVLRLLWQFIATMWGLLVIFGVLAGINADSAGFLSVLRENKIFMGAVDLISTHPLIIPMLLGMCWFFWWFHVDLERVKMESEAKGRRSKHPETVSRHKKALRTKRRRGK